MSSSATQLIPGQTFELSANILSNVNSANVSVSFIIVDSNGRGVGQKTLINQSFSAGTTSTKAVNIAFNANQKPGTYSVIVGLSNNKQTVTYGYVTHALILNLAAAVAPVAPGFFISPTGKDSNPGTLAEPFLTLEKAQAAMRSGSVKTAYLRAGTFSRTAPLNLSSADSGETWTTYPNDAKLSGVIVNNGSKTSLFQIYDAHSVSNITIENLSFIAGSVTGYQAAVFIAGNANGIHVVKNKFQSGNVAGAIYFYNSDNIFFQGNTSINDYQPVTGHLTDGKVHQHIYVTDNSLTQFTRMGIELQNNSAATVGFGDVHVDRNTIATWTSGPAWSNDIALSLVTGEAPLCNTVTGNKFLGTIGTGAWAAEIGASNTSVTSNTLINIEMPFFISAAPGSRIENNLISSTGTLWVFNADGGFNGSQWVGANSINGVITNGWAAHPNKVAEPALCAESPSFE